jgi:hypothetical protein
LGFGGSLFGSERGKIILKYIFAVTNDFSLAFSSEDGKEKAIEG